MTSTSDGVPAPEVGALVRGAMAGDQYDLPGPCDQWQGPQACPPGMDPEAFRGRPAMWTTNIPAPGEVERLLADREGLRAFLVHGLRLFRRANSRTWSGIENVAFDRDASFGQKSTELAREEILGFYAWLHRNGPCLLLLIDQGLLGSEADTLERETQP